MNRSDAMTQDFEAKYDPQALETGYTLQPVGFEGRLVQRDAIDQHFTKLWLEFTDGLARRTVLDERLKSLTRIAQFTARGNLNYLEDSIRQALASNVPVRDVLEVILQCVVYGGNNVLDGALDVFEVVVQELGLEQELRDTQMPVDGRDSTRDIEDEKTRWHTDDLNDPRLPRLVEQHGWLGISSGALVRPKEHMNVIAYMTALDPDWARLWERYVYQGMYGRGVLDDKTRILCIVANCVALGEGTQIRNHIRSALGAGAHPREVLEIIFQSCQYFGMPPTMQALALFYGVIKEEGRLDDIGDPPFPQREHGVR